MKTSLTVERLRQVVRVLEELPKEAGFSLEQWKCGTTACAIGWAAQDPWFKRRRFRLDDWYPIFRSDTTWDAVESFFGIEPKDSRHLFSVAAYMRGTRQDVIRRINAFCAKAEPGP